MIQYVIDLKGQKDQNFKSELHKQLTSLKGA